MQLINKSENQQITFPDVGNLKNAESFLRSHWPEVVRAQDVGEKTIKEYDRYAEDFIYYLNEFPLGVNTMPHYKRYLGNMASDGQSTKTLKFITARILLNYLFDKGFVKINLTKGVKNFQKDKRHKRRPFSPEEIKAISEYLDLMPDYTNVHVNAGKNGYNRKRPTHRLRMKLFFELAAKRGLRLFEITAIKANTISFSSNDIEIKGKMRDFPERIQLQSYIMTTLSEYLKFYQIKSGYVFPSPQKKGHHLTKRQFQYLFKSIFDHLRIEKGTIHRFRHYFVTELSKKNKGDVNLLKAASRIKSEQTLAVYNEAERWNSNYLPALEKGFE